ncbi:hypothetical protein FISHEDRAFT_35661 [Fistulina hepatica ATCC 64428]|uniref:Uncharacterized protein n=1 Tax=Fistulina hepatica ATCC 64428 TaxID=1128425 RepID=A0A0D7AK25_9AGAR|nr:hypothetical protein FISHEDRAFT_35661 [Fistulina hepatica ATCC 64428]
MLSTLIAITLWPFADFLYYLSIPVHPTWFPYPVATVLHAGRISLAFQANARRVGAFDRLTWSAYITGFLIMCWGGGLISHALLALPPPQLYSFGPYINYLTIHLCFTALTHMFPSILNHNKALDTLLFPVDALVRTKAIIGTISLLGLPEVDPVLAESPLAHLILGAIGSSGGGVMAATLSTWTTQWSFSTPIFLRPGVGWIDTIDVWGGALVAAVYSIFSLQSTFYPVFITSLDQQVINLKLALSFIDAQAFSGLVLTILFGIRVYQIHYMSKVAVETKIQ